MFEIDQTYLAYELAYRAERMRGERPRPAPRGSPHPAQPAPAQHAGTLSRRAA